MATVAFGVLALIFVGLLAVQHAYWRRIVDAGVLFTLAQAKDLADAEAALAMAAQQHRDQETLLTVASAEIARLTLGQPPRPTNVVAMRTKSGSAS